MQIHNKLGGIGFFGGTVGAKYVVLTGNADDSLDWTDDWSGRIQYLCIEQTDTADNASEADDREGDEGATPRSDLSIANTAVLGKSTKTPCRCGAARAWRQATACRRCGHWDSRRRYQPRPARHGPDDPGGSFACAQINRNDDDGAVAA